MAKGLPDGFPSDEKGYALYEGVEYQQYWDDPHLRRQDVLERYIISEMLPTSGRRILDLGAGYGRLAPCYVDRFDHVVLCDGSLSLLRDARTALGDRATLVACDLGQLPFKTASFDCVLTIRVLQHVQDLPGVLGEIRRILGGDARLVFSYHNKRNAKRILRHFAARGAANPFSSEPVELVPTLISRHPEVVDRLVSEAGFSAADYQGTAFVHPIAGLTEALGRRTPAGAGWARLMGRQRLAPWLIGQSLAQGAEELRQADSIPELFECPSCRGSLDRFDTGFECSACHRRYPIEDGIADLRPQASG